MFGFTPLTVYKQTHQQNSGPGRLEVSLGNRKVPPLILLRLPVATNKTYLHTDLKVTEKKNAVAAGCCFLFSVFETGRVSFAGPRMSEILCQ